MRWWVLVASLCSAFGSNLDGVIFDQSGAVVSHASVELLPANSLGAETAVTGAEGRFHFGPIPAGDHLLTIEAIGFQRRVIAAHVLPDKASNLRIELEIWSGWHPCVDCRLNETKFSTSRVRVTDVCEALSKPDRNTLTILIGVLEDRDAIKTMSGECKYSPTSGPFRLPTSIQVEVPSDVIPLALPKFRRDIQKAGARIRKDVGTGPKIVALAGYLDALSDLQKSTCKRKGSCTLSSELLPAQLIGVVGMQVFE